MGTRKRPSVEAVAEALRQRRGYFSYAAEMLGCDERTVSKMVREHPTLQAVYEEIREKRLDTCELHLERNIQGGDSGSIRWYLEQQGASRGYGRVVAQAPGQNGPGGASEPVCGPWMTDSEVWAAIEKMLKYRDTGGEEAAEADANADARDSGC